MQVFKWLMFIQRAPTGAGKTSVCMIDFNSGCHVWVMSSPKDRCNFLNETLYITFTKGLLRPEIL